jgi:outer membrane biosynthesis protein TonB
MVDSHTEIDHATTATLAGQSLANSVAIAVSDATTALRNVQAIMTTVQSVAMARWLASGERDDSFQQIANTATQITRDAVRLWQEVQATAQNVLEGDRQSAPASEEARETTNASRVAKPPARKSAKKAARKPTKPVAAKRAGKTGAAKKPVKPKPAAKKAAKKAPAAKPAGKPRKARVKKPAPAPAAAPPADVFPTEET